MAHHVENALEIYVNYVVKISFLHGEHELVARNSRIVYKNINVSEVRHYLCDNSGGFVKALNSALVSDNVSSESFNLSDDFVSFLFV